MCNGVDPTRPDPLTMSGAMDTTATSLRSPRTFASAAECARDVVGVAQLSGPLAAVYLHGQLDATLRERVMVAVSTRVHETEHRARPAVGAFNDQIEVGRLPVPRRSRYGTWSPAAGLRGRTFRCRPRVRGAAGRSP